MANHFSSLLFILLVFVFCFPGRTQNYHAIQGSSFAGSLGVGNNPASIVNTPYAWDVNLLSTQLKYTTNAITVYKYSLLSAAARSEYALDKGNFSRYASFNFNINIINARFALNRKQSMAFGMNVRSYGDVKTSPYNYLDTVKKLSHLFKVNQQNTTYEADILHSSWVEIFATYSRTIWDAESDRLNAGITIKVMRGISGAHGALKELRPALQASTSPPAFRIVSGSAGYGYSSNYDAWKKGKTRNDNLFDFMTHSEGGVSVDIGAEYLIKSQEILSFVDEENYFEYDWKIGLSVLDIGQNNFKYGNYSRNFNTVRPTVSDAIIQKKFKAIKSVRNFNDSLSSIVNSTTNLRGVFTVINPARMVLNIDRNLLHDLYLNAEISLNVSPLAGDKKMFVKELNFLTITPRWETRRWGGYLPVTYNNRGKLWVGGALKARPFLIGIHNWGNVFSSRKMANGGGYVALVLRANHVTRNARDKRFDCPTGL